MYQQAKKNASINKFENDTEDQETFSSVIECPICRSFPLNTSIVSCKNNGHSICGRCSTRVTQCPICREKDMFRNRFAEDLFSIYVKNKVISCPNEIFGCGITDLGCNITNHFLHCQFENVSCPNTQSCTWKGPISSFHEHLQKDCVKLPQKNGNVFHSILETPNEKIFIKHTDLIWKPFIFPANDKFIYLTIRRQRNGTWFFYVKHLSESPDKSMSFTLNLKKFNSKLNTYNFKGVVSDQLDFPAVKKSGMFLFLCDEQIKVLKTKDVLFEFELFIE